MRFDLDSTPGGLHPALLLAVGLVIAFPIVLFGAIGSAGVQVFSVIVTSLLTLALVVLYFQQYSILDRQTALMSRDYQSVLTKYGTAVADDDEVRVRLKNSGRGKVRRLFLKSEIASETGTLELGYGRVTMKNADDGSIEIPPESDVHDYVGQVRFRVLNHPEYDPDRWFQFSHISRMLSGRGVESVRLKLSLEVIDEGIVDDEFSQTIDIVDQVLSLDPPKSRVIDGEETTVARSTSVEDAIGSRYSSTQDLNRRRWDESAHSRSDNGRGRRRRAV